MAKKFILKSFAPGARHNGREKRNNLFNLSGIGMEQNSRLVKQSLSIGASEVKQVSQTDNFYDAYMSNEHQFMTYADYTSVNSQHVAFFNRSYPLRREYLRMFAQNSEISFVLDTIADETIICDDDNYFAYLNIDKLKTSINKNYPKADLLITTCEQAYKRIYSLFNWDSGNDAWEYLRKFLIDGILAFEIIYEYDDSPNKNALNIIAFKELDPVTLEPSILIDEQTGEEIKVWYQFKGDSSRQRIIPDANLIYISWAKGNFVENTRISYLEGLTRSFNMLRQLENSRIMWNIQNAQKRLKFVVPMGEMSPDRAKQRLDQLKAFYNEETLIDDASGEITVNGLPKFSFTKTYMFPSINGAQTEVSEMGVEGYDMNSTEQLKYFWRRFILETKVPANRFTLDPAAAPQNQIGGDATVTREEVAFARFIQRIRSIFKELLIKPTWIQVCLQMPELAQSNYFYSFLGLRYFEDNLFTLAKERTIATEGSQTVSTLSGLQNSDQTPVFSMRFLLKKYLGLSDEDWKLNEEYKHGDKLYQIKHTQQQESDNSASEGMDFGGDMNGGFGGDMSVGDMSDTGGDMGTADIGGDTGADTGEAL